MNKFTNDKSEKKYQNVYKVGGKMPIKNVVKKKKQTTKEIFNVGCNCEKRNDSPQKTARKRIW